MKRILKFLLVLMFFVGTFLLSVRLEYISAAEVYPFNGMISADSLVVHNAPNTSSSSSVTELAYGTRITVTGISGSLYKITYDDNQVGYVSKAYIKNVDANMSTTDLPGVESYSSYCTYLGTQGFPESYCPYLYYLHAKYPEWVFKADIIGKTLDEVSKAEENKCSLQTKNPNYWLNGTINEADYYWIKASVISSFMDPRNSLFEDKIFQFFDSDDNKDLSSDETLNYMVGDGYLKNFLNDFKTAASIQGINVVQLVSRSKKEGNNTFGYGSSSGTYTKDKGLTYNGNSLDGYYNFYNIQATGKTPVTNAVAYAASFFDTSKPENLTYGRPWNTPAKGISGGAEFLASSYIKKGQDTAYYQKFNVSSYAELPMYSHQYMTNIDAPESESAMMYTPYKESNTLRQAFIFTIPVYKDMGDVYQPENKSSNNYLSSITLDDKAITFDKEVKELGNINLITTNATVKVGAKTESSVATVTGTGNYTFNNGVAIVKLVVKAEDGSERTYTINIKQVLPEDDVKVDSIVSKMAVKISGNIMYGISPGETVQNLINTVVKNKGTATIYDKNGKEKKTGTLYTSDKITIKGTTESKTYVISVRGDTNGDGKISSLDLLRTQKHILKVTTLKNEEYYAADTNYDNKISSLDLLKIQKHILGKGNL